MQFMGNIIVINLYPLNIRALKYINYIRRFENRDNNKTIVGNFNDQLSAIGRLFNQ